MINILINSLTVEKHTNFGFYIAICFMLLNYRAKVQVMCNTYKVSLSKGKM